MKSLSRTIPAAAVAAAVLAAPVFGATSATAERTTPSTTSAEQTVAFGVPAWMGRMFWNQVNKQHTTPAAPRCAGFRKGRWPDFSHSDEWVQHHRCRTRSSAQCALVTHLGGKQIDLVETYWSAVLQRLAPHPPPTSERDAPDRRLDVVHPTRCRGQGTPKKVAGSPPRFAR